jgi:signal transduction histidine kinase
MKSKVPASAVPYHSLESIISKLQLKESEFLILHQHRDIFTSRRDDFAAFFYKSFSELPETQILLERFGKPDSLMRTWSGWFERIFTEKIDSGFISYLWRIGLKHVEINLDQRFSSLGFSLIRQFIHQITRENFPPHIAVDIMLAVDKLVDFCVFLETSAYIDATIRCDMEILRGVADKIRNPVTIIGGNLRRLQRKLDPEDPLFKDYDFLISYAVRFEEMVADINTYMSIFQRETSFERCMLDTIMDNMISDLSNQKKLEGVKVEVNISPTARFVLGDPIELRYLFYHLIENAAEAACAAQEPFVRISSMSPENIPHAVKVEVFNNGDVINLANIANILTPFFSTKSSGSGLGLSIAKLAARKNFGQMDFEPLPLSGTKVCITLQSAE